MKRFHVLIALAIGASVVFVAKNGFNRNFSDSLSSSNSSSFNSPTNLENNSPLQQTPNRPSLPQEPPKQLTPPKELPKQPQLQPQPQLQLQPLPPPPSSPSNLPKNEKLAQPNELPKEPPKLTNPSDLAPGDKLKQDVPKVEPIKRPTINEPPSDGSEDDPVADESSDSDAEQSTNNEPQESEQNDPEKKVHTHKEHHEHHHHQHYDDKSTVTNNENINFILLASYFRSGSSFVGDLLQQSNGTFYTFEPFKYFDFNHKVDSDNEEEALRLIQNIFQCSISEEENYSDWICPGEKAGSSIKKNHLLGESCEYNDAICCEPDYVDQICSQTRIRLIKETRLSLESVEKLLQNLPSLKVVFLVRDPRGIYNSRKRYVWCKKSTCIDYEQLCEDLTSDLKVYPRLVEKYGNRVMIVRFEDIALDTYTRGEALYRSLGLPYTSEIIDFIETHTNEDKTQPGDPFTVLRNVRDLVTAWTTQLNETIIEGIQDSCKFVLEQLGYKPIVLSETINTDDDLSGIYDVAYSLPNHL